MPAPAIMAAAARKLCSCTLSCHHGLASDVREALKRCNLCARARATFNARTPRLQPLPICGLFYRWGVDLFGPLPAGSEGHRYVMVAIEHLSKHIELVPLRDKTSGSTAQAFAACVLGRFRAPAEVLTDRGSEWGGQFEELLLQCMIDHRHTSANHPQADGLAERAVGTCKRALRKMVEQAGTVATWAKELPWLMLGYNCSPQQSTGFAPYQLLYARSPLCPQPSVNACRCPSTLSRPRCARSPRCACCSALSWSSATLSWLVRT
jgi:transposase InsO family protein